MPFAPKAFSNELAWAIKNLLKVAVPGERGSKRQRASSRKALLLGRNSGVLITGMVADHSCGGFVKHPLWWLWRMTISNAR
jgi:hypothetical protein